MKHKSTSRKIHRISSQCYGYTEKPNVDIYAIARKENFWKALYRSKGEELPKNVIDFEQFIKLFNEIRKK